MKRGEVDVRYVVKTALLILFFIMLFYSVKYVLERVGIIS